MTDASIQDVYNKLNQIEQNMVTKDEIIDYLESVAVLSNPDTIKQIKQSRKDMKTGNYKEINDVDDI